jgi:hypothetical protein
MSLVAALASGLGAAPPAGADHGINRWHSEAEMINSPTGRETFVVRPAVGTLLDRDGLLAHADLYGERGFSRNFLWYAPETERVVDGGAGWASCADAASAGPGSACSEEGIRTGAGHTVGDTFGGDERLHLYEWGGAFIARSCGNFSTDGNTNPVPRITGVKFRDADRDGERDDGERLLSGWDVRVTRVRSDAGQSTGPITTVTTNASGRYTFALDGHGPGLYRVTEVVPEGWQNYTPVSRDVTVRVGVGDHAFTADFGNAETTTDVAKTGFELVDPPTRLEKDQATDITVRSEVTNRGPAGPIEVDEVLSVVEVPPDCTVTGLPPGRRPTLDVGGTVTYDDTLTVTCAHRSNHRFVLGNDVGVAAPEEVTDVDPTNDSATIDVTIPVFEQTELGLDGLTLTCDEYWAGDPFTCEASARVTNAGDAAAAQLLATLGLNGSDACTTAPGRTQDVPVTLDGGEAETVTASWSVTCPDPDDLHTFVLDAGVRVDEPHLEAEPQAATLVWVPVDVKPDSDPNSLNVGRPGLVSVALLSTADLDTTTAIDPTSLRWGPTGTEATVVRCGSPEDANHDGRLDLVCRFRLGDAGFATGDTLGIVTGLLTDGRPFTGADRVRIT